MDSGLPSYFSLLDKTFIQEIKFVCFLGSKMLIVTKSDKVFGLGELPDSSQYQDIYELRPIHQLDEKRVKEFIFGSNFVIALTETGELYSWGENNRGQLGLGHSNRCVVPTKIDTFSKDEKKAIRVICGSATVMVLCNDVSVHAWGENFSITPAQLLKQAKKENMIACSSNACFILKNNGEVRGKGYLMQKLYSGYSIGDVNENKTWSENRTNEWVTISFLKNIVKIAAGKEHAIALDNDGVVFVWGNAENKLLQHHVTPMKLENISKKIIDIAANPHSYLSAAMTENSEIYVWPHVFQGKTIPKVVLTHFTSFNEVFIKLSTPSLTLEPIIPNTLKTERTKYHNDAVSSIFDVQDDSDLTISIEGKNIFVHKLILKMNSTYFQAMFTNQWKENVKKILKVEGYSYESFRSFLSYLYTGEIDVTSENVFELMKIADRYSDDTLLALIEKKIDSSSIPKGVVNVVKEMMKLSSQDYETFCDGMEKFVRSSNLNLCD